MLLEYKDGCGSFSLAEFQSGSSILPSFPPKPGPWGAFVFKRNNPAKLVWQEFLILNIYLTTNDV